MAHEARRDHSFHPLQVSAVAEETADTRSFTLLVPPPLRALFTFDAGQFCTFRVPVGDEVLTRCYSMSSAPTDDADTFTVTVKRMPGGAVSTRLVDGVRAGDALDVQHPSGVFRATESDRAIVAFAGGSGITPIMSIARTTLAAPGDRRIALFYANRDRASVIFDGQLGELADTWPDRLEVQHHLDDVDGWIDAGTISAFVNRQPSDAEFYICGPTPFMDLVESTLLSLGIEPERILLERFTIAPSEPTVASGAEELAGGLDTSDAPAHPEQVTIILKGRRTTCEYLPGDTIIDTGRRAGLSPPFSCEQGNCATCMALLRKGRVRMKANTALTDDEVAEGWILTCQSVPEGADSILVEYEG